MKPLSKSSSFPPKVLEKALEFYMANENFEWFSRPEVRADMDSQTHRKALEDAFARQREARNDLTKALRSAKTRVGENTVQDCINQARAQTEEESADEVEVPAAKTPPVPVEIYPEVAFVIARELAQAQKEVTRLTSREVRNSLSNEMHRTQLEVARESEVNAQVALVKVLAKAHISPNSQTIRDCIEQVTRQSLE